MWKVLEMLAEGLQGTSWSLAAAVLLLFCLSFGSGLAGGSGQSLKV